MPADNIGHRSVSGLSLSGRCTQGSVLDSGGGVNLDGDDMTIQKAMVSSKSNEWSTPKWFYDLLDKEFNFTLDPCSTHENTKCKKHYTLEDDGLSKDWSKDVVFMNPPYGGHAGKWIEKACVEADRGAIVACLIVAAPHRSYWHDYIFPRATQIRWLRGRLAFGDAKETAPFGSAIVIFGSVKLLHRHIYYKQSLSQMRREVTGS